MAQILLLSSEQSTLAILTKLLKTEGFSVVSTTDPDKARELITSEQYKLMITSAGGDWDPDLEILRLARTKQPAMPAVILVERGGEDLDSQLEELSAFATIPKPLKVNQLMATVQQAVDYNDAALTDGVNLNLQLETTYQLPNIIAESQTMKSVCDMASRIAATDVTILITGASGVGKSAMADAIHKQSRRSDKQFAAIDCSQADIETKLFGDGGMPGALMTCDGGTLLLEKISDLPRSIQKKLQAALLSRKITVDGGEKPFDARIITSTREELDKLIKGGMFSSELYKLLKLIQIKIPPLRTRPEDIMPTFRQALQRKIGGSVALPSLDQDVIDTIQQHTWPKNIDEMELVAEHAMKLAKDNRITKDCLPAGLQGA